MKAKKAFRIIAILGVAGLLVNAAIGLYLFNMSHHGIESTDADYSLTASFIDLGKNNH